MYSLFVTHDVDERPEGLFYISSERILEYTDDEISSQLRAPSVEASACLRSWPCLIMQEGRGEQKAYVVRLTNVERVQSGLKVVVAAIPGMPELINDSIWKLRDKLDLKEFEFNRHHWAVKKRDLLEILTDHGHCLSPDQAKLFSPLPLPFPARGELLEGRKLLAEKSHTDIDYLLLEAGVDGLDVPRSLGSRADRANAIFEFISKNPSALTAEKHLFNVFFRDRTKGRARNVQFDLAASTPSVQTSGANHKGAGGSQRSSNRVFIVHGRNDAAREAVVNYLSTLGLEGVVLHEQANMGRHLLTKFIGEAELTTFAVVLMTADDVGGLDRTSLKPRARQNVILELGYFLAYFGQKSVCALMSPGIETPSDFDGIVYISMDADNKWKHYLRRELIAADMPVAASGDSPS